MNYRDTEAEFPALRRLPTYNAAWYRLFRRLFLAKYPHTDPVTRDNLDMLVRLAAGINKACPETRPESLEPRFATETVVNPARRETTAHKRTGAVPFNSAAPPP